MNPQDINILVGCEESQAVCKAFRARGFNAFSCDEQECSGGHPEWHIVADILTVIKGGTFITQSGAIVTINKWHAGIFFPPCTYLATCANRSFVNNPDRWKKRLDAMLFVHALMNSEIQYTAIENPKGVISTHIRKPDLYVHPYYFGDPEPKLTGLWLKNLPKIITTNVVSPEFVLYRHSKNKSGFSKYGKIGGRNPSTNNPAAAKLRSRTYPGIAEAMAQQWGDYLLTQHPTL